MTLRESICNEKPILQTYWTRNCGIFLVRLRAVFVKGKYTMLNQYFILKLQILGKTQLISCQHKQIPDKYYFAVGNIYNTAYLSTNLLICMWHSYVQWTTVSANFPEQALFVNNNWIPHWRILTFKWWKSNSLHWII